MVCFNNVIYVSLEKVGVIMSNKNTLVWEGTEKMLKPCVIFEAECAGQEYDCAGKYAGLHNFVANR